MAQPQTAAPTAELPLQIDDNALKALGVRLVTRFNDYKRERREVEVQWLRNLRQYLGQYDPEILEKIEPDRSRAYPKLTRIKVVSMVSRLMALLRPHVEHLLHGARRVGAVEPERADHEEGTRPHPEESRLHHG
jgi:hypothetical protein